MPGPTSKTKPGGEHFLVRPAVGTGLTIVSGLFFLLVCMILPLVGKAGIYTSHYAQNLAAFVFILLLTIASSGLAIYSKLERRKSDGSPLPYFSLMVAGLAILLFLALISGLLKI
ncbi:MAG: hypothetical protein ACO398_00350 [Kiritimatiellia bacterium]|jgi:hypothetical protein